MSFPPSAIVYSNAELAKSTRCHLERQLFITQTLDGYVFDDLVAGNPNYISTLRQMGQRVLVLRTKDEFFDRGNAANWTLADVVLFIYQGLATAEVNKFGPPGITIRVLGITWGFLGIY